MTLLLVVFFLSFCGSFLFAGFETGFISWNRVKVEHRAAHGDWRAKLALWLGRNPAMVITTVLIGNNIALVGMSYSFSGFLKELFGVAPEVVVNATLTATALIFCELLPKSLFRIYSFRMTLFFLPLVTVFHLLFLPVSLLINLFTGAARERVPRSETLKAVAYEGGRHRHLSPFYARLVDAVFSMGADTIEELFADLVPLNYTKAGRWVGSDPKALLAQALTKRSTDSMGDLLDNGSLFSCRYIVVQRAGEQALYCQEQWFEFLFMRTNQQ